MLRHLLIAAAVNVLVLPAWADNWPAWRGPDGMGHCMEKDLPLTWSDKTGENILWKVALPDQGNSTPIVWGERIFLTQATDKGQKRWVMCLSTKNGAVKWKKPVEYQEKERTHATNPPCASSPVTDGERVVASHGSAGVVCYDMAGKQLWHRDLGKCDHIWGHGASPVIHGDLVILNFGPGPRTFLIALDKRSGDEKWRVEEPGGKVGDDSVWIGSWTTPVIARIKGRETLFMSWPDNVKAYDPKTGDILWTCKGMTERKDPHRLVYTSPLVREDILVAMGGFHGPQLAVKPGGKGDVTKTHKLWGGPQRDQRIGSGLIIGDYIYTPNENALQCLEVKTGKSVWRQEQQAKTWGSMVQVGDRIYVTNDDGETLVLAAKPKFEVLARNPLPRETTRSSIAIADGRIYIRTYRHLWCIGKKE